MAHIYSGSRLCLGLAQEYRLLLPGTYHYAPYATLQIQATASGDLSLRAPHETLDSGYYFWGRIITRPTRHFRFKLLRLPGTYHYAPHTTLQIQATTSGDLSLRARHDTSGISSL